MSNTLNEINVMSYDYHGAWDHGEVTNFNSQATVQAYKDIGVDPAKLNLGIPAYGRTYANVDTSGEMIGDNKGLYRPF